MGIVRNVIINKEKYSITMATEEPSVIAAANYGCKLVSELGGGFLANSTRNIIRGQIFFDKCETKNPL